MNIEKAKEITTQEEARQFAVEWQAWQSTQVMSYSEMFEWQEVMQGLGKRFKLSKEFKENGVI